MQNENMFAEPKVFLVGCTQPDYSGMRAYLKQLGGNAESFLDNDELESLPGTLVATSFASKLCYLSFAPGVNENVSKVRDIEANVANCIQVGHGSVLGHTVLNFVFANVSRAFTHELVRHEVGTKYQDGAPVPQDDLPETVAGIHEYSQQSGRYVSVANPKLVLDPVLAEYADEIEAASRPIRELQEKIRREKITPDAGFGVKKEVTNAVRYLSPVGGANDIMFTVNARALRHILAMRTSESAAWEIRKVFHDVYHIVKDKLPWILQGAQVRTCAKGLIVVETIKTQPYQV